MSAFAVAIGGKADMGWCTSLADGYRQMGLYVGKVLRGVEPAELPVVQLTRTGHKPQDFEVTRVEDFCKIARSRGRGDRVTANVRYWPKADIAKALFPILSVDRTRVLLCCLRRNFLLSLPLVTITYLNCQKRHLVIYEIGPTLPSVDTNTE